VHFYSLLNLNVSRDGEEVICEGKSFHVHAPVTGKARRPTVESLTAGTDRLSIGGRGPKFVSRWDVSGSHYHCVVSYYLMN